MKMRFWVGVDSTDVPSWHTEAETERDCRDLIAATYTEEGDTLLTPRFVEVEIRPATP